VGQSTLCFRNLAFSITQKDGTMKHILEPTSGGARARRGRLLSIVVYDKVRQSVTSKSQQSMDQSQARNGLNQACDWSMLCFALLGTL